MMKRVRLFHVIVWLVILLAICLLSPLNLHGVLPSGTVIAPVLNSALLMVVSQLILLGFNQSDWLTVVVTALATLFSGWVVRWQQATSQELRHQQMITIGISSGLIILVLLELAYLIVGWRLTGSSNGMIEIARLALPILLLRLGKKWLPSSTNHESSNDSVIIDMGKKQKKKDQDNQK